MWLINKIKKYLETPKDPVKECLSYKERGCSHVDGMLCEMEDCGILKEYDKIKGLKMYVVVRDDIPLGFKVNSALHAVLSAHEKFENDQDYDDWFNHSFKKVTCVCNESEFRKLKNLAKKVVITESDLGGREVAIALCPRYEWPNVVKYLKLLK
jgi:hypothetical protein